MKFSALVIAGHALTFLACNKADQSKAKNMSDGVEILRKTLSEANLAKVAISLSSQSLPELIDKETTP
jgi:hypothetical protein